MADKRDYYEVLGVDKNADDNAIKKGYRQMAKKYHPDMNPGDKDAEAKFKEVNEAYAVLSDPEKKQIYDQYGHDGLDPTSGAGQGFGGFGGFGGVDLGDIFGSFFGGGSSSERRNAPRRGDDITYRMTITFEEAAFGCTKELKYNRIEACKECNGTGADKGSGIETCSRCKGTGTVTVTQRTMFGMMQSQKTCDSCRGRGKIIKNPCQNCRGSGNVKLTKKLDVSIPAGVDDGGRICLRGQGNAGVNGGSYGDLYIIVSLRPHEIFERSGNDIYCEVPVSYSELVLGGEIEVPTLEGTVKYNIPEGTQTGTRFCIKNKGIVYYNTKNHGDLYFTVVMETPKNLSSEAKDALRKFAELCENSSYVKKQKFYEKISKIFKKK
ncbi:MAG: molecular chaperone DnaJ [Ruminococcaceae bacterium]|nr:molecular chaperone DnaJ [Oscillospiraceae bacterium]